MAQSNLEVSFTDPWADVEPLFDTAGDDLVCKISYRPEYALAMSYFRAVLKSGELSARVLDLTEELLRLNPAHYTVWHQRHKVLQHLSTQDDAIFTRELAFLNEFTRENKKNYQLWHHRQFIVASLAFSDSLQELEYLKEILALDEKNYHAWSYRQWYLLQVKSASVWEEELKYVEYLLEMDVRNNSAWNQRYFVTMQGGNTELETEVTYTFEKIAISPNNESSWNYLNALFAMVSGSSKSHIVSKVKAFIKSSPKPLVHALSFLLEMEEMNPQSYNELVNQLIVVDPLHKAYWASLIVAR